jgi:glutamyl-tRNA reductase
LPKLGALDDRQRRIIEQMTARIVKQLLHQPIRQLRQISDNRDDVLPIVARLFGLDRGEPTPLSTEAMEEEK